MEEIFKVALSQGLGYGLFVFLLLYVLKTTGEREKKYQDIIDNLTQRFGIIQEDVKEIKNHIFNK